MELSLKLPKLSDYFSGWGKNVFGNEGKYQAILKKIELPIVSFNECQEAFRKTRLYGGFILHNSFICAGGETGKGTVGNWIFN